MPLTVRQIEAAKPSQKPVMLTDGNGLSLLVERNGNKGWRLRYYRPNGKRNMISLGSYPQVTLAEARDAARDARKLLAKGIDPAEQRKSEKRAKLLAMENTFQAIAKEWHEGMTPRWKETSSRARLTWNALDKHVFPQVGQRPIADIDPLEWLAVLRQLEQAGKLEQRRRVHSICRSIYQLAIVTGRAKHNPLSELGIALAPQRSRHFPHVSQKEIPELLRAISAYQGSFMARIGLKLLFLTAVRPGELRLAHWTEFNLKRGLWRVPANRMKQGRPHHVPLPKQAVALLEELRRLTAHSPMLFPGRNDATRPISDMTFARALERMGYRHRHTPHGTRHLVATELKELGFPREWIEAQLAHKLPGMEGVYTHAEHMSPKQRPAMMQQFADHLDKLEWT